MKKFTALTAAVLFAANCFSAEAKLKLNPLTIRRWFLFMTMKSYFQKVFCRTKAGC